MHWFGRIPSIFVLSQVLAASATPVPQAVASDLNLQELGHRRNTVNRVINHPADEDS